MARKLTTEEQVWFEQLLLKSEWGTPKANVTGSLDNQMPEKPGEQSANGWLEAWFPLPVASEQ